MLYVILGLLCAFGGFLIGLPLGTADLIRDHRVTDLSPWLETIAGGLVILVGIVAILLRSKKQQWLYDYERRRAQEAR